MNRHLLLYTQGAFIIFSILLYPYFKYNFDADGISYISIAQHYVNLDFKNAINGTWSPLISWLLSLFIVMGFDPLLSFRVINVTFGLLILYQVDQLANKFIIIQLIKIAILLVTVCYLLFWSLYFTQSDLIPLFFLLLYANLIYKLKSKLSLPRLILIGVVGACAYFSKSYNLIFFIAHFSLFFLILFISKKHSFKALLKCYLLALFVFSFFASLWIIPLSYKYEKLTFSNAGKYNHLLALFKHENENLHLRHLCKRTLIPPPNTNSINVWEDVAAYGNDIQRMESTSWIILFKLQSRLSLRNFRFYIKDSFYHNPFILIVLLISCFLYFRKYKTNKSHKYNLSFLLSLAVLYPIGYLLIIVSSRYFWFSYLILVVLTYYIIAILVEGGSRNKTKQYILVCLTSSLLIAAPVRQMWIYKNMGKPLFSLAQKIKSTVDYKKRSRIASLKDWDKSLNLSYLLDLKYFGQTQFYESEVDIELAINKFDIEYFITNLDGINYAFLEGKKVIFKSEIEEIIIYELGDSN